MLTPFFSALVQGLLIGSVFVLLSIGLALILGVMGIINFAHGEFMMLGMFAAYFLFALVNIPPILATPLIFVLFLPLGFIIQRFLIKPSLGNPLVVVIITLGLSNIFIGTSAIAWGLPPRLMFLTGGVISIGDIHIPLRLLSYAIISIILTVVLYTLIKKTDWGKAVRATAADRETAEILGINTSRIHEIVFAIGIGLTGVAGAFLATVYPVSPLAGVYFALIAFIVVLLGGSITGCLAAGLLIGITQSLTMTFIGVVFRDIFVFLLFVIVLSLRPTGLFGTRK